MVNELAKPTTAANTPEKTGCKSEVAAGFWAGEEKADIVPTSWISISHHLRVDPGERRRAAKLCQSSIFPARHARALEPFCSSSAVPTNLQEIKTNFRIRRHARIQSP